jgi:NitT/TauT family transport system permease protein
VSSAREALATPPASARRARVPLPWITTPALIGLFFLAWHAYVAGFAVSRFILPPPLDVWDALVDLLRTPSTWRHVYTTVHETVVGFAFACVIGVGLGALLGKIHWLERTLNPFVIATQVVPKIALVPLFIVWFGFGLTSKIIVAAVLAFFPIFTNTLLGVKSVDLGHRDVMASLNASRATTFWRLELPSALPYILIGMEVGIVLSIIGAVVGEYLGGNRGLGYLLVAKMNAYETDSLFAVIVLLAVVGSMFYGAVGMLRRWVIPWHESVLIERGLR